MIDASMIPRAVIDIMMKPITYPAGATVETIYEIRMAAALNAWPGVWEYKYHDDGSLALILPLPQEPRT